MAHSLQYFILCDSVAPMDASYRVSDHPCLRRWSQRPCTWCGLVGKATGSIKGQLLGKHMTMILLESTAIAQFGSRCMVPAVSIIARLKARSSYFFPTCQVRVVRFYQSACPPPPPPSPPPPSLAVLLALLLASASSTSTSALLHLHFRLANLANSSPNTSPTSQLSAHCWTSTCELPSSVCTAGPQPGTCPAQCAPLGLNRGPSQLSVHRWTSTWDLPSSVCTAGPQPGTCPAQCAPLDLNGQIECQKICQMECQIECQKICQIKCHVICQIECQKVCQIKCQKVCQIECQKKCQIEIECQINVR